MSNDLANRHSPVITVVPLTSKIRKKQYLPTHVFLNSYKNTGLGCHSLALCEQITSVAFSDVLEVAGRVSGRKRGSGCDRLDALTLAKKLAVLARIYALGLLNEDEYTRTRNRIMQEHNVVTFE